MKDLYSFDCRHLKSSLQVESIETGKDDYNLIAAKYEGIKFPVLYKQVAGKKLTDILATGVPSLLLISQKLKNLLEENFVTGWTTYPIILKDKQDNQIEGYHGFSVKGVSGPKSYINSPVIEKRLVESGPIVKFYKGANIDLNKWDGADFFIPEDTIAIITTRVVANLLEKNQVSNAMLNNVSESEMSVSVVGMITKLKK